MICCPSHLVMTFLAHRKRAFISACWLLSHIGVFICYTGARRASCKVFKHFILFQHVLERKWGKSQIHFYRKRLFILQITVLSLTVKLLMPSENAPICLTVPSESSICKKKQIMDNEWIMNPLRAVAIKFSKQCKCFITVPHAQSEGWVCPVGAEDELCQRQSYSCCIRGLQFLGWETCLCLWVMLCDCQNWESSLAKGMERFHCEREVSHQI